MIVGKLNDNLITFVEICNFLVVNADSRFSEAFQFLWNLVNVSLIIGKQC